MCFTTTVWDGREAADVQLVYSLVHLAYQMLIITKVLFPRISSVQSQMFRVSLEKACHRFPKLSATKNKLQALPLFAGLSTFTINILKSLFPPLAGNDSCGGGGQGASSSIRAHQRQNSRMVWRASGERGATYRPRGLQLKTCTLRMLFTETSTKCEDLCCVEGNISKKCTGDLCRC